jgi:hypothetical protein
VLIVVCDGLKGLSDMVDAWWETNSAAIHRLSLAELIQAL